MSETTEDTAAPTIESLQAELAAAEEWKAKMVNTAMRYAEGHGYRDQVASWLRQEGFTDIPTLYRVSVERTSARWSVSRARINVSATSPEQARELAPGIADTEVANGNAYWEDIRYVDPPAGFDYTPPAPTVIDVRHRNG